jgi:acylphosphatase
MDKPEDMGRVRLRIEGRVQGVFFRASTVAQAKRLGVTGWVRNCADGTVELLAEGERNRLEDLAAWCRHGPPGAQVHDVQLSWQDYQGEFRDFKIRR